MCGRAKLSSDFSELKLVFGLPDGLVAPNFPARYNLAPTQTSPIVRFDAGAGQRTLEVMRWGLVPAWAKDVKIGYATFNARADGIAQKPAFRDAFRRRRCLVPLDAFYEWRVIGPKHKQPHAIARADGGILAMAGLWDTWRSPEGEILRSFTIVTTTANAMMAELHDRMPVILSPEDWRPWLGEVPADADRLTQLLRPYEGDDLITWPVDPSVGNVRNEGPQLIARWTGGAAPAAP